MQGSATYIILPLNHLRTAMLWRELVEKKKQWMNKLQPPSSLNSSLISLMNPSSSRSWCTCLVRKFLNNLFARIRSIRDLSAKSLVAIMVYVSCVVYILSISPPVAYCDNALMDVSQFPDIALNSSLSGGLSI